jgi:hypothetical protein
MANHCKCKRCRTRERLTKRDKEIEHSKRERKSWMKESEERKNRVGIHKTS